jgi:hypothetical protein
VTAKAELWAAVEAWIGDDPDAGDRAELRTLYDRAFGGAGVGAGRCAGADRGGAGSDGDAGAGPAVGAMAELPDRFADRLHFGTARLRGRWPRGRTG